MKLTDEQREKIIAAVTRLQTVRALPDEEEWQQIPRMKRTCRFCGCSEFEPCIIEDLFEGVIACSWLARDVCSAPSCVTAWQKQNRKTSARAALPHMNKRAHTRDRRRARVKHHAALRSRRPIPARVSGSRK